MTKMPERNSAGGRKVHRKPRFLSIVVGRVWQELTFCCPGRGYGPPFILSRQPARGIKTPILRASVSPLVDSLLNIASQSDSAVNYRTLSFLLHLFVFLLDMFMSPRHVEVREQPVGLDSLLPCGSQEKIPGCRAWPQAPFPLSHWLACEP